MAASIHPSSSRIPTKGYELIEVADASRNFAVLYYAIQRLLETDPTQTFEKVENFLKTNRKHFYLVAYPHPQDGTKQPEWPEGTQRSYSLYLCGKESTLYATKKLGEQEGYLKNFAELKEVGFSPIWLRDHRGSTQLPIIHLMPYLQQTNEALPAYLEFDKLHPRGTFAEHWDSLTFEQIRSELIPFKEPIAQVYAHYLNKYCMSGTILEAGSGCLPVVEFLPSLTDRVTLSDNQERFLTFLKRYFRQAQVRHFDTLTAESENAGFYGSIIMTDVFNQMFRKDIAQSAKTLFDLLPAGGHLLHFSIRHSIQLPIIDELVAQGYIYCPWITHEERLNGFYAIKKEEFTQALERLDSKHTLLKSALELYASWPENFRHNFCIDQYYQAYGQCSSKTRHQIASYSALADAFQFLQCPSLKRVDFDRFHDEMIQSTLENAGFKTVEFTMTEGEDMKYGSTIMEYFPANHIGIDRVVRFAMRDNSLGPRCVKTTAKVYALVLQKPHPEQVTPF